MKYIYYTTAQKLIMVLNMSFDKFLLAVESCDLSQADKSIIRVLMHQKPVYVCEYFIMESVVEKSKFVIRRIQRIC